MSSQIFENLCQYELKNFDVHSLKVNSEALKRNPLKDSYKRLNPVLVPRKKRKNLPVVFILSGYSGNSPFYFNPKLHQDNAPQVIDKQFSLKKAPSACYVFVDALTYWGGSQFINSKGHGKYEDYIIKELRKAVLKNFDVSKDPENWCVMGGSSGGYGALHLVSKFPQHFKLGAAIAPDSFFDQNLLPELYKCLPIIEKMGGIEKVKKEIDEGKFFRRKNAHDIYMTIAMGFCYSAKNSKNIEWPINYEGEVIPKVWKKWLEHDPLVFLKKRSKNLKKISRIFLDVGKQDQFNLQYGSRQIAKQLKNMKIPFDYSEFNGNHFDISERRVNVWQWLNKIWKQ